MKTSLDDNVRGAKATRDSGLKETGNDGIGTKVRGRLVTLETFIIDSFTKIDDDGVERDFGTLQMGGGGTYAILGARLFVPSSKLGMIVDYTAPTLNATMRAALEMYGEDMWFFRERTDGHGTTQAMNRYKGDTRIVPDEQLRVPLSGALPPPTDLLTSPATWLHPPPSAIHMISDAKRLAKFEDEMVEVRKVLGNEWDPIICWEPEPYDHVPENCDMFTRLAPQVDIISPNHTEALSLLSLVPPAPSSSDYITSLKSLLEQAASRILALRPRRGVVIRAGPLGAYYIASSTETGTGESGWVPPFYAPGTEEAKEKVVDPTGAGNGFMGALSAALGAGKALREAVRWGSVAASFIIEQDGLPTITVENGRELWNGVDPWRRLAEWSSVK